MGDLCRALGKQVLPFCDEIMVMLLENLGVSTLFHLYNRYPKVEDAVVNDSNFAVHILKFLVERFSRI